MSGESRIRGVAVYLRARRRAGHIRGVLAAMELERFLAAGKAAWPGLPLDDERFVRHVAERETAEGAPLLDHAGDMYLACACAYGVAGAHAAFEQRYGAVIRRAAARKNSGDAFVEEAAQRLREQLFVAAEGLPKIAQYRGRSPLQAWLTLAASRAALMLLRGDARRREATGGGGEALAGAGDQELAFLKQRYAPAFSSALAEAFTQLSNTERTLLELHIVGRASIDELGALYKVGRSTAARWIAAARDKLVEGTRSELRRRLGLSDSEYESLAGLVRSQLDVSVVRLLEGPPKEK
jgi:RNA polymerase sigma-70 factor (ECF subfamily)